MRLKVGRKSTMMRTMWPGSHMRLYRYACFLIFSSKYQLVCMMPLSVS